RCRAADGEYPHVQVRDRSRVCRRAGSSRPHAAHAEADPARLAGQHERRPPPRAGSKRETLPEIPARCPRKRQLGLKAMKHQLTAETAEMIENAGEAADFLKKFAHPSRLMIVCALVDGERSVRDLEDTLGIRQPGLSQQIAELRDAGFIVGRKESKSMFYRLANGRVS